MIKYIIPFKSTKKSLVLEAPFEKARPHKYIRREGTKGNYTYTYIEPPAAAMEAGYTLKTAKEYGAAAFHAGKQPVPAMDKDFMDEFIKPGMEVGSSNQALTDYLAGWHEENLKAPIKKWGDQREGTNKYRSVLYRHGFKNIGAGEAYSEWLNPETGYKVKILSTGNVEFEGKNLGPIEPSSLDITIRQEKRKLYDPWGGRFEGKKIVSPQLPEGGVDKLGYELPEDWKDAQKIVEPLLDKYNRIDTGIVYLDKDDGVKKKIRMEVRNIKYPYEDKRLVVWAEPVKGPSGTGSAGYRKIKSDLGDDWSSDITTTWFEEGHEMGSAKQLKLNKIVNAVRKYFEPTTGHLSMI